MKALLITALFMEFISVNTASAAEEIQIHYSWQLLAA